MATCKNGHYYPDDKAECPYCPKSTAGNPGSSGGAGLLRTVVGTPSSLDAPPGAAPPPATPLSASYSALKTQIASATDQEDSSAAAASEATADRKLMGWLATFDRAPMGLDFRLREGRNVIGTAPDCDVRIEGDSNISGRHLTILFRLGEVLFRDELSTNGSFINGNLANEGRLRDGDIIRVGNTHLLFRSAQTNHTDDTI